MHRHTGQGSAASAEPVSSATVKRRSLLPIYFFKQGTKRFAFWHLRWVPARRSLRSLGRNDAESLGSGRNEHPYYLIRNTATTSGLASVEMSPKSDSPAAILRRMRRMIFPERVLGNPSQNWI
jgi:hypothetical protein